ncbi:hypothetical protein MYCTH_2306461 [Thermothelomyces thermophilus ATCC 42464]|uniref:Clr5 domain-containing protein n=1 Tax=Thermothelomyces thermophilus (strain ATCC 42464 / BCRC 31852 / DSM 1799) TaxID=573729 RepID=G2QHG1_THET4|nr:uncharacterized protein MYCTH_2306461 [Thermothelomyces thermophilus ATCC 42464]AEO58821.1 hypothetical protein MYCTH_2306461 [Thermothelomyces thermophilus ATCC 42464]
MTKQWDKYREIIIAEYRDQNKPLHEVRRFMMEKHGFRASYVQPPLCWLRVASSAKRPHLLGAGDAGTKWISNTSRKRIAL